MKGRIIAAVMLALLLIQPGCSPTARPSVPAAPPQINSLTLAPVESVDGGWQVIQPGEIVFRVGVTGADKITLFGAPTGTGSTPEVLAERTVAGDGVVELTWKAPDENILMHIWVEAENAQGQATSEILNIYHEK